MQTTLSRLVAVQRHDREALAELYRRHGGSVFHIALRVLAVRGLAEEVVQDIFTRLWQSPERFDAARGSLRSFLLAQAHGRAIDIVRSETARRRREKGTPMRSGSYTSSRRGGRPRHRPRVRRVVETLAEPELEAISLAYFGGHSYVDVASLLGVPEGTVKSRIRLGLARLRKATGEAGIDPSMANSVIG